MHTQPKDRGIPPLRIKQNSVCELLDISRSGLQKLIKRDPTFPKPIKEGSSRQAAVYFILEEIEAWLTNKAQSRQLGSEGMPAQSTALPNSKSWRA